MAKNLHPQQIIARVRMSGTNLRRLAAANGYAHGTLNKALDRLWPNAHKVIADQLGCCRSAIWPEFYAKGGVPLRRLRAQRRRAEELEAA